MAKEPVLIKNSTQKYGVKLDNRFVPTKHQSRFKEGDKRIQRNIPLISSARGIVHIEGVRTWHIDGRTEWENQEKVGVEICDKSKGESPRKEYPKKHLPLSGNVNTDRAGKVVIGSGRPSRTKRAPKVAKTLLVKGKDVSPDPLSKSVTVEQKDRRALGIQAMKAKRERANRANGLITTKKEDLKPEKKVAGKAAKKREKVKNVKDWTKPNRVKRNRKK